MSSDQRKPPSETGFSDLGSGLLVPQALYDAQWARVNGYDMDSLDSIAELHEERALYEGAQAMRAQLPSNERALIEASGDWRLEFDSPYNRGYDYERLGILGVYTLLREWNVYERMAILERCHMAHERNPLANTAVGLTTLFVVGKGLNVTYQNPDVEAVLKDFIADPENDFRAAQKEYCNQLQVDGEVFVRFYTENGRTLIATVQPWFIKWIEVDPNFRKRVISYKLIGTFTNGAYNATVVNEDILPDEMLHLKINAFNYEVRGRPELFRILPWLKAYKDWLEERARINRRQGSMYFDMTLKNATPSQVSAARSAYKTPPPPASIFVHNDNVMLQAIGGQVRASDAAQDGREMKLMALAGLDMPEYMFGEGRNSTKATSSNQELPALAKFEDFQTLMVDGLWKPVLRRVIQNAVEYGDLPSVVPVYNNDGSPTMDKATGQQKMIPAVEAFDCDFPDLRTPDPLTLAQALQIHMASGLVSNETASMVAGYNYTEEQDKLQREQQQSMANGYAAGAPTSPPIPATQPAIPVSSEPRLTSGEPNGNQA